MSFVHALTTIVALQDVMFEDDREMESSFDMSEIMDTDSDVA